MTPLDIAWSFLKSDEADWGLSFSDRQYAGTYYPADDYVDVNLGAIIDQGRKFGFADKDIDKYTANVLGRMLAHEFGHAVTDGQEGVGNLGTGEYGKYSINSDATARTEHPANILEYPESALVAHKSLLEQLEAHQYANAGAKNRILAALSGRRVGEEHPMRGITGIMQQIDRPHPNKLTPQQKEQRFREILGVRARNPMLRQTNSIKTPEQWDKLIAEERMKDKQRFG